MADKTKNRLQELGAAFVIAVLSFIAAMQTTNNLWTCGEAGTDSAVFKYLGWLITTGRMPYKDGFDHKGPLLYLINALGIKISYWRGIWVIELLFLFGTFYLMYRIARLFTGKLLSLFTVVIAGAYFFGYFDGGNLTEEYAMLFIACGLYVFLDYFKNNHVTPAGLILCGISFGAVCMIRANMVTVWIVMCIAVLLKCIHEKKWKDLLRFIAFFIIGACIVIVPIVIWLATKGAFRAFVEDYIIFNRIYTSNPDWAPTTGKVLTFIYFMNNGIILLACCISAYLCWVKRTFLSAVYAVYMLMSFVLISMSGQQYNHYGMVLVPALVTPFAVLFDSLKKESGKKAEGWFAVMLFSAVLVLPGWMGALTNMTNQYAARDVSHISDNVQLIVNYIDSETEPDEPFQICGNWNILYDLSQRRSASVYDFQSPVANVDKSIQDKFLADLERTRPKVIVVETGDFFDWFRPRIEDFISSHDYTAVDIGQTDCEIYRLPE